MKPYLPEFPYAISLHVGAQPRWYAVQLVSRVTDVVGPSALLPALLCMFCVVGALHGPTHPRPAAAPPEGEVDIRSDACVLSVSETVAAVTRKNQPVPRESPP